MAYPPASAFPHDSGADYWGLTKRQYIATAIAAAIVANPVETTDNRLATVNEIATSTVKAAYLIADKILEQE